MRGTGGSQQEAERLGGGAGWIWDGSSFEAGKQLPAFLDVI